jgi:hypothetical protein
MSFNVTNGGLGITDRYWGTAKRSRPRQVDFPTLVVKNAGHKLYALVSREIWSCGIAEDSS